MQQTPKKFLSSSLLAWFDKRLPIISLIDRHFLNFPIPRNLNLFWVFGIILVVILGIMVITGSFLAIHYTPSIDRAFDSIELIDRRISFGWLLRSLHVVGSNMFMIALYLHLFRSLYYGSYKDPREMQWITGITLFMLVMMIAFAGYILPWGQMSYWGIDVISKAIGSFPIVGDFLQQSLIGGSSLGDATLGRMFVLHITLGFVICFFVMIHIWTIHVVGLNNPLGINLKDKRDYVPFYPYYVIRYMYVILFTILILSVLVFFYPDFFINVGNYQRANPLVTVSSIKPEWYFLSFYGLLQCIPFKLGGILLTAGAVAVLLFLPWLDQSKIRSARFRPWYRVPLILMAIAFIILGLGGYYHMKGGWMLASRLATFYYFLHFLVFIPLFSIFEPKIPLPEGIEKTRRLK